MIRAIQTIAVAAVLAGVFVAVTVSAGGVHYDEASSSYVSGNGTVAGDMTFGAATHLKLPLHNDPTTPTIGFGDFDTGLFELSDGQLAFSIEGLTRFTMGTASIFGATATAAALMNEAASTSNPTLLPSRGDVDTGISGDGSDDLYLLAGAQLAVTVSEASSDTLTKIHGGLLPALKSSGPCGDTTNYPTGTIFWNSSDAYLCYCNGSGQAKISDDGTCYP